MEVILARPRTRLALPGIKELFWLDREWCFAVGQRLSLMIIYMFESFPCFCKLVYVGLHAGNGILVAIFHHLVRLVP